ncbi:hypothetical protein [Paraburkholderia caledonica]
MVGPGLIIVSAMRRRIAIGIHRLAAIWSLFPYRAGDATYAAFGFWIGSTSAHGDFEMAYYDIELARHDVALADDSHPAANAHRAIALENVT